MSDAGLPLSDQPDPAAWARGVIERHVALEEKLAEAALRLALAIEQGATQAVAENRPVDKDAALAFARVAKAVRMSGLMQARLIKDMEQAQHRAEAEQLAQAKRALATWDKAQGEDLDPAQLEPAERHKHRVTKIVARIAEAEHGDDEEEVERLMDEAAERLDDEDIYDDVLARPVGELVSRLCRDLNLNLKPDWSRLSEEAWAREEIESGVESSPFARPPPVAAANGGGGPPAERSEQPVVVGESHRITPAEIGAMWKTHAHADHYP